MKLRLYSTLKLSTIDYREGRAVMRFKLKQKSLSKDNGKVIGSIPGGFRMSIFSHRWIIAIALILILVLVAIAYYYSQNTGMNGYKNLAKRSEDEGVAIAVEKTSKPIDQNATPEQKASYYSTALWLKIRDGDNQATSKYYLDTVKPAGVNLNLDVYETLIPILIETGHKSDAKALARTVVSTYKQAPATSDPLAKKYIDDKIQKYTNLEKTL